MSVHEGEEPAGLNVPNAPEQAPVAPSTSARAIPSTYKLPKGFVPLDGAERWDAWSFRLRNVFQAEDVWGVVTGTEPQPADADRAKLAIWMAKERAAQITINLAVAEVCIPLVENADTPFDVWKALSDAYKSKGLLSAFHYRAQLISYRFNESSPLGPQINHLRQLRVKITAGGIPCEDWDFAICILGALPESYSVVKQSIFANQTDMKKIDVSSIISLITQDEMERKGNSLAIDPEASFAARQGQKHPQCQPNPPNPNKKRDDKKPGTCNWCRREGHWESDCRKKKESQAQAQMGGSWVAILAVDEEASEKAKTTLDLPAAGEWWEFDSGATRVFHGNRDAFADYTPFDKPIPVRPR